MEKWPYVVAGDIEAAVIDILYNAPELSGFSGGRPEVTNTLDGYVIGDRWIFVTAEGGGGRQAWVISQARIDCNVFAENRKTAELLAQTALGILFREMGQPSPAFDLRTLTCKVETAPVRSDDRLNDSARYLFALRYTYVPYSGD